MQAASEKDFSTPDGLRLFYRDFPAARAAVDREAGVVLCLHGLTRNGRDFLALAAHLQSRYRVIVPDLRGRGRSTYDPHWQNYHPGTYVADMFALLDTLRIEKFAIVGTSLGALMAMLMSAQQPRRIGGIVLNDAGPEIDPRGLARIAQYAGKQPVLRDWQDAARYVKSIYGDALRGLSDAEWLAYAQLSYRENADGIPVPDCDPNIGAAFRAASAPNEKNTTPQTLWPVFAQIHAMPTLVIRGEHSDILSEATLQRMADEKSDLQSVTVPNRGHAPLLNEAVCTEAIDRFLGGLALRL